MSSIPLQLSKEVETKIINELTNTRSSSYQVAFRYKLRPQTINRIGIQYIGKNNFEKREQLINSELDSQIRSLSAQGYTGAEIAKELGLYSSTCYKIIAGKISLVENTPSHDDSVEIVSLDDEHTESQLKQVPMNSAKTLPAVDESKIIRPELPAEDSKSQISDHSSSKAPVLNERKVLNQLSNTVRLYFNGIRINYNTELSIEQSVAELLKNMQR